MNTTILLFASDAVIRKAICRVLESEGYCVLAAGDIGSAAHWLKNCPPDLLMVRHYTEAMPGHDAAVYLRKLCPGIPVLLVGGVLDDISFDNRAGVQRFVLFPKPFEASELLDMVKEVLAKRSTGLRANPNLT
jgi:DNA-binding NtrC family response regulator